MNTEQLDLIEAGLTDAAHDVRDTMLGGGLPAAGPENAAEASGLLGRIHVGGDLAFTVELRLSRSRAAELAGRLLGMPVEDADPMVDDAFGEFANLVVGSAKSRLRGHACTLSVPEVSAASADRLCNPLRTLHPGAGLDPLRIDVLSPAA